MKILIFMGLISLPVVSWANGSFNQDWHEERANTIPQQESAEEETATTKSADRLPKARKTPQNQEARDTGFHVDRRNQSDYQRDVLKDEIE